MLQIGDCFFLVILFYCNRSVSCSCYNPEFCGGKYCPVLWQGCPGFGEAEAVVDGGDHSCASPHVKMLSSPRSWLTQPRITPYSSRGACVCAGAAQGLRRSCLLPGAGQPGGPGLLPAAEPALARPQRAPASGGVCCREGDEERRCSCHRQPVQSQTISAFGSSLPQRYRAGRGFSANEPG